MCFVVLVMCVAVIGQGLRGSLHEILLPEPVSLFVN
jgi:hypothetical protein